MHIPDKHPVEDVEEALEKYAKAPPAPTVKVVINVGAAPPPHGPMKKHMGERLKKKKKRGGCPGKHESALSSMY